MDRGDSDKKEVDSGTQKKMERENSRLRLWGVDDDGKDGPPKTIDDEREISPPKERTKSVTFLAEDTPPPAKETDDKEDP